MTIHSGASVDHKRFETLDGMRGVAALMVMIYHYNFTFDYGFASRFFINIHTAIGALFPAHSARPYRGCESASAFV
jgi:peptidoglycan/LPS O-acetylase OafA/YrhL